MKKSTSEAKSERFIRIAEQRTQKVLEALRALSNCATRASYDYAPPQVEQIFEVISSEVKLTRSRFDGQRQFSLSPKENEEESS